MLGHRAKLSGDEVDVFHARRFYQPPAGVAKWFKAKFNRKDRKRGKTETRKELADA